MASTTEANSLFEIHMELDALLEEIERQIESEGQPSEELVFRFQEFCEAHGEKVDRIGRFVRMMEAREQFCRAEAARLGDRARAAAGKIERTKNMALYYLLSRDLKKIEGQQFTLRAQKNSQGSVRITDETALPMCYRRIEASISGVIWETVLSFLPDELAKTLKSFVQETRADNDAIKRAVSQNEMVLGAHVLRGWHEPPSPSLPPIRQRIPAEPSPSGGRRHENLPPSKKTVLSSDGEGRESWRQSAVDTYFAAVWLQREPRMVHAGVASRLTPEEPRHRHIEGWIVGAV